MKHLKLYEGFFDFLDSNAGKVAKAIKKFIKNNSYIEPYIFTDDFDAKKIMSGYNELISIREQKNSIIIVMSDYQCKKEGGKLNDIIDYIKSILIPIRKDGYESYFYIQLKDEKSDINKFIDKLKKDNLDKFIKNTNIEHEKNVKEIAEIICEFITKNSKDKPTIFFNDDDTRYYTASIYSKYPDQVDMIIIQQEQDIIKVSFYLWGCKNYLDNDIFEYLKTILFSKNFDKQDDDDAFLRINLNINDGIADYLKTNLTKKLFKKYKIDQLANKFNI